MIIRKVDLHALCNATMKTFDSPTAAIAPLISSSKQAALLNIPVAFVDRQKNGPIAIISTELTRDLFRDFEPSLHKVPPILYAQQVTLDRSNSRIDTELKELILIVMVLRPILSKEYLFLLLLRLRYYMDLWVYRSWKGFMGWFIEKNKTGHYIKAFDSFISNAHEVYKVIEYLLAGEEAQARYGKMAD